jgi:excisionase family DNA binding protein
MNASPRRIFTAGSRVSRSAADGLGRPSHLPTMNETTPAPVIGLERLLSIEELSDYLGVPVRTLYDWRIDRRGPKALHAGRVLRYPESAVRAWIQENLDA